MSLVEGVDCPPARCRLDPNGKGGSDPPLSCLPHRRTSLFWIGEPSASGVPRLACRGPRIQSLRLHREPPAMSARPAAPALLMVGIRACALAGALLFEKLCPTVTAPSTTWPDAGSLFEPVPRFRSAHGARNARLVAPRSVARCTQRSVAVTVDVFVPCPGCCSSAKERPCSGKMSPPAKRRTAVKRAG